MCVSHKRKGSMKSLLLASAMIVGTLAFVGCKKEETLGNKIDKAAKSAEKGINTAAADAKKSADKAAADAEKAADKAAADAKKAGEDAKKSLGDMIE